MIIPNLIRVLNPKGKLSNFYNRKDLNKWETLLWYLLFVNILEIGIIGILLIIFATLCNFWDWAYYPLWICIGLAFVVIILSILSPIIFKIITKKQNKIC